MSPYRYLSLLILPAMVWGGYLAGGYWNYLTPLICFGVFPLIELLFPGKLQYEETLPHKENENILFRIIPLLFTVLILATVISTTYIVSRNPLKTFEWIGLMISVGILNGAIGFTLAHEFIHRFTFIEKSAGYLLLCCSNYLHYHTEHIYGHHVYACTQKDPHTARQGESFYKYLPRAIARTWLNGWEIEMKRLHKRGITSIFRNKLLLFFLIHILICTAIVLFWGKMALLFFIGQSFISVTLLHQVNYLQHYGLHREDTGSGKFEKMAAHHSWNIANPYSKFSLFQLTNHADHHLHPAHSYEKLTVHPESPSHPANYACMMIVSLIPPLWFNITHKRISVHHLKHST
ncbi:MAG: alkane 1-monooxygenase [Chitinophagaceae bacterium]